MALEYWNGWMNWPVRLGWTCQTCGKDHGWLEWGIVHGTCRCGNCHTQYDMGTARQKKLEPQCRLKSEYKAPAKWAWEQWQIPVDELSDTKWKEAFAAVGPLPEELS